MIEVSTDDIVADGRWRVTILAVLVPVLLVAAAVAISGWGIDADTRDDQGAGGDGEARGYPAYVDYHGIRIDVPDGVYVQDVAGMVDGEMACPDVPVMLLAGRTASYGRYYVATTCRQGRQHRLIRIYAPSDFLEDQQLPDGEVESQNGFEFIRGETGSRVRLLDPPLTISAPSELLAEILESLRPSPADEELSPPTTHKPRTEVTDRLSEQLACEQGGRLSTYSRAGEPMVGRQIEAPVSCYVGEFGYRIMVIRYQQSIDETADYYENVYLIMDDHWIATAMSEDAAAYAHDRIGGEVRPPHGNCCSPPPSNPLPGSERGS